MDIGTEGPIETGEQAEVAPEVEAAAEAEPEAEPASPAEQPPAETPEEQAAEQVRIKLGEKEYTPEEAQAEYEAVLNRLKGADKTTADYRARAEQALHIAEQSRKMLIDAGILSPDGQTVARTPDQIRAATQTEPQFEMPTVYEDNDALWSYFEKEAQEKGLKFGLAHLAVQVDTTLAAYHERLLSLVEQKLGQRLAPMEPFFNSLEATQERGNFLYSQAQMVDGQGESMYPELKDASAIAPLNRILDDLGKHGAEVHTPAVFHYAIQLYRAQHPPQGSTEASAPPPSPRSAPQVPPVINEPAPSGVPRQSRTPVRADAEASQRLLQRPPMLGGMVLS